MFTRTKIVCTIGPSVNTIEKMMALIDAGMNVARINFSHGTQEQHQATIEKLKKAREKKQAPLAIMLDTKGPEIRIGEIKSGSISLSEGQRILLVADEIIGDEKRIFVHPPEALNFLEIDHQILFDDGYISAIVIEKTKQGVLVELQNSGVLKTHKKLNLPGIDVDLPAMTEEDIEDLVFGCKHDIDLVAASFIRSAEHVNQIKQLLAEQGKPDTLVIAKIESRLGVENFDSIVQVADGIMVARGDLGVEMPLKEVPILQKMMIRKCIQASKPVITATQMLESMVQNPRPTRAEVSDVANAIYDSTSAVMLSAETATGSYPIQAVEMMRSIIEETEKQFPYQEFFYRQLRRDSHDVSSAIATATVNTAYCAGAKAIFAFTSSGLTARLIGACRPQIPVIALTPYVKTYHLMSLFWGITPAQAESASNAQVAFSLTSAFARAHKFVEYGDLVVLTAGSPFGISGTTNMMVVESIGEVLVRAVSGKGEKTEGKIAIILSPTKKKGKNAIVVISKYDASYLPIISDAKGAILQNHPGDFESEKQLLAICEQKKIPCLIRADRALSRLEEGQAVVLDPTKCVVYRTTHSQEAPGISDPKD